LVDGSQLSAKSSESVATSVEPGCLKQWFIVRYTARPEWEKLKAEGWSGLTRREAPG
jgi:hypothetical protein